MQFEAIRIPYLLMNADQKRALFEEVDQLEFDGIQTKNLDICPSAYREFKKLIETARAGELIGEPTGHNAPSKAVQDVVAGMTSKPSTLRNMQFRHYTGL
jgi:hypothetical protein